MMSSINGIYIFTLFLPLSFIQVISQPEIDFAKVTQPFEEYYQKCAPSITCDASAKYRTINGSCNNLEHPVWGSIVTPYLRLGPAAYCDNEHAIRVQSNGQPLPNSRLLTLNIFLPKSCDINDCKNYHMHIFGQWITHDMTLMLDNILEPPNCCAIRNEPNLPPQCGYVLEIPPDDPIYCPKGITCIEFRRTMTSTVDFNCPISPQIPMNQASPFIDASHLYGHSDELACILRTLTDGKLKTENVNGLPFICQKKRPPGVTFCDGREGVNVCLGGGDPRSNMHFGVIVYQEVFLRLHNFFAEKLKEINKSWEDEELYQASRKMIGAINQIWTYREYLPILLGKNYSEKVGLTLHKDKKTKYDPTIMPQVSLEFVAAAFRVPHNQIPAVYFSLDKSNKIIDQVNLNEYMSNPDPLVENQKIEQILRGMSMMPGRFPTSSYNSLISNYMFADFIPIVADQDLLSIDIQRGRDTGVIPYVQAREMCCLSKVSSFDDLKGIIKDDDIELLKKYYADVKDIDFIVGALLEELADDAMVGETARCFIAKDFYSSRYGDRFFCDVEGQPGSFTKEQFDVLWDLDLTRIFCAMTAVEELPSDFFMSMGYSPMQTCKRPLDICLDAWKTDGSDGN